MSACSGADSRPMIARAAGCRADHCDAQGARAAAQHKPAENVDKFVEFYDVTKIYPTPQGPAHGRRQVHSRYSQGRVHFADRSLGLRQVDRAVDGRRTERHQRRRHRARWARSDLRRSGSRRRVPGAESAAVADCARERGARRRSRVSARQCGRATRHRRVLPDARRACACARQEGRAICRTA